MKRGIFFTPVAAAMPAKRLKDELLRVDGDARSVLAQLDEQEPEAIGRHRDEEVRKTAV